MDDDLNIVQKYPRSSDPLRLNEEETLIETINEIPIYSKVMKLMNNPPPQRDNVYYIVSLVVAQKYATRSDFLIVNHTIRNEKGQIIGCRSFAKIA